MQDKTGNIAEAISLIPSKASVMVGGFGSSGTPFSLIDEILNQGQTELTIIKNDANETNVGIYKLIKSGQVKKIVASHIGLNPLVMEMSEQGELDIELIPQGIMAERIRCAGAGTHGFLSTIGLGLDYAENKNIITLNNKDYIVEEAIYSDFALIHAQTSDTFGNLQFNTAGINFSPLMAKAANTTIAETKKIIPISKVSANNCLCSGVFVDHIIPITSISQEYAAINRQR